MSQLERLLNAPVYPGSKTPGAGRHTDTRDRHSTHEPHEPTSKPTDSRTGCRVCRVNIVIRVNVYAPYHATPDRGQKYRSPRCLFTVKKTPGGAGI